MDKYNDYIGRLQDHLNLSGEVIELNYNNNLGDVNGFCDYDYDMHSCTITINSELSHEDLMITVAHEMVHASQYFTKKMVNLGIHNINGNKVSVILWDGVPFGQVEIDGKVYAADGNKPLEYHDQPWEVEAYAMEKSVYERCRS